MKQTETSSDKRIYGDMYAAGNFLIDLGILGLELPVQHPVSNMIGETHALGLIGGYLVMGGNEEISRAWENDRLSPLLGPLADMLENLADGRGENTHQKAVNDLRMTGQCRKIAAAFRRLEKLTKA